MRRYTTLLGEDTVTVNAPTPALFDPRAFREAFPAGGLYGLDVESTYMGDLGQFAEDFRVRLIQFATRDYAWVLDISDPDQRKAAVDLLSDETVHFCSHTNMDVLAVSTQLGVDITRRNYDTHILAVMSSPDDALGGSDLKSAATRYGMPQLEQSESVMHTRFKELWCQHVDTMKTSATDGMGDYFDELWSRHCEPLFAGDSKRSAQAKKAVQPKLKAMRTKHGGNDFAERLIEMWERLDAVIKKFPQLQQPGTIEAKEYSLAQQNMDLIPADGLTKLATDYLARQAETLIAVKGLTKSVGRYAMIYAWDNIPIDDESYLVYAGLDAIACRRLVDILIPLTGAPRHLIDREMWLAGASNRTQIKGALVDQVVLDELHSESQEATDQANAIVQRVTGYGVRQTAKLIEWFGQHGADWTNHPKTNNGAPSLAKSNLKLLDSYPLDEPAREALSAMLEAQLHADALMKTQGVINATAPDGRVRSTLKTVGTVTARMSSRGPNMQNFSKRDPRVRGAFIPDPGNVLIACDFAQIELRVAAALSGEQSMIDVILAGGDLHQLTADMIGSDRDTGKTTNFQVLYGGGARAVSDQTGLSWEEARVLVYRFWEGYPKLAEYNQLMQRNAEEVRTISYRRVPVRKFDGEPKTHANLNSQVQSSARDLIVGAWQRFDQAGYGHMIWGLIHDEMVIEAPEDRADEIVEAASVCMTRNFRGVPIEADAHVLRDKNGVSRWGK